MFGTLFIEKLFKQKCNTHRECVYPTSEQKQQLFNETQLFVCK